MDNKIVKMLIPIIAVIVIFESVVLVSSLEKNGASNVVNVAKPTEMAVIEEKVNSFDLSLLTEEGEIKVGKKYKVSVKLTSKENYNLNALDLYVKYDPNMVTISNLIPTKELQTPTLIKVSDKKNVVVMNYLFEEKNGAIFTKDKETVLLTFTVTPKLSGITYFQISTGDNEGDSVTMFVDKNTSNQLNFTSNKLEMKILE